MENLDVFFQDPLLRAEVTVGSHSFFGILDQPDEVIAGGAVISTEYSLIVKSSDADFMSEGGDCSVDGVGFEVRTIRKFDDGKLSRVELAKV